MVLSGYPGFFHHYSRSPWYSWNIAESCTNKSNQIKYNGAFFHITWYLCRSLVTRLLPLEEQELFTPPRHLSSTSGVLWGWCSSIFSFLCVLCILVCPFVSFFNFILFTLYCHSFFYYGFWLHAYPFDIFKLFLLFNKCKSKAIDWPKTYRSHGRIRMRPPP